MLTPLIVHDHLFFEDAYQDLKRDDCHENQRGDGKEAWGQARMEGASSMV